MLAGHHKGQHKEGKYWRMFLPHNDELRRLVTSELHGISFMPHPGVSRTVSKVRNLFYWKGIVGYAENFLKPIVSASRRNPSYIIKRTIPVFIDTRS